MTDIHPSAVISPNAHLDPDVRVGAFCVIEDGVTIGRGCQLAHHVVIKRGTRLGCDNQVCEGAVLGGRPQHLRAGQEVGGLLIGDANQIREQVTIHAGLTPGQETRIGSRNLIMVSAHIAHDCLLGDQIIIANNVMLAGHITVGDRAYISGAAGFHQFCRIGKQAMVGGQAHIKADVPPFMTVDGKSSLIVGLNVIGLRRNGYSGEQIEQLKRAYRLVYRSDLPWAALLAELGRQFREGPAAELVDFLGQSRRGFVQERRAARRPATLTLVPPPDADSAARRAA